MSSFKSAAGMSQLFGISLLLAFCIQCKTAKESEIPEISAAILQEHVQILASDSLQGRGAGYAGEQKAATYILSQFKAAGLDTAYFQPFKFHTLQSYTPWEVKNTQNVLGILKGSRYPNEYIVIGGHHDGQGMPGMADFGRELDGVVSDSIALQTDRIWNSAVDNAVSIAAIMELARVLATSEPLDRSIIFTTFSAEESGLDGSTHFVNQPPVPLKSIKAMVNLEKIVGDPDAPFLYVSYGTNPLFETLQKATDSQHTQQLLPFYPGMIANSDHYAFGQRRIPAITMGTGSEINVHTPLDHAEGLNYDLLKERTIYIKEYLTQLASAENNFEFTGDLNGLLGVSGGMATEAEKEEIGVTTTLAFKVTSVVKDSKGAKAGLIPEDLVLNVDNQPIKEQNFYQGLEDVIGETEQGTVVLEVVRNGETLQLQLGLKD